MQHTFTAIVAIRSTSSSFKSEFFDPHSINPATKYPVKQSPAPVVSTTDPLTFKAGISIVFPEAKKMVTPAAPRVQTKLTVSKTFTVERSWVIRDTSGISVWAPSDEWVEGCDVKGNNVSEKAFTRALASPSLTTNQSTAFQGNL